MKLSAVLNMKVKDSLVVHLSLSSIGNMARFAAVSMLAVSAVAEMSVEASFALDVKREEPNNLCNPCFQLLAFRSTTSQMVWWLPCHGCMFCLECV